MSKSNRQLMMTMRACDKLRLYAIRLRDDAQDHGREKAWYALRHLVRLIVAEKIRQEDWETGRAYWQPLLRRTLGLEQCEMWLPREALGDE